MRTGSLLPPCGSQGWNSGLQILYWLSRHLLDPPTVISNETYFAKFSFDLLLSINLQLWEGRSWDLREITKTLSRAGAVSQEQRLGQRKAPA